MYLELTALERFPMNMTGEEKAELLEKVGLQFQADNRTNIQRRRNSRRNRISKVASSHYHFQPLFRK